MSTEDGDVLFRLSETLASRRNADPEKSYTARLFAKGPDSILKKIGEEGAELIMAAKDGERANIVHESADLIYHIMALLSFYGMGAGEVLGELRRREGTSGIDEKKSRVAQ
ncbi:MAG: phosphoribosyl-ATP diphosphatase [Candidatus Accumulibacter sp.]|nr:phosphoribosyl-ATP diphosphatase [Accumulibacter sp.]